MEEPADNSRGEAALWVLGLLALLAVNALWTLRLFDSLDNPSRLLEPTPIVSGKHALHCYHGSLGAQSWLDRGISSSFDPNYLAGYPKSPVFDSGCRPAELFYIPGHKRSYVSYKMGVFVCCLLVPVFFSMMARGLELSGAACLLAGLFGMVVWWARLNTEQLVEGELDVLLGGICALLHCCWLIRFAHQPSLGGWAIIFLTACGSWYIQPICFFVFIPPVAVHYLWNAGKHHFLWHVSLHSAWGLALALNAPWLREWLHSIGLMLPIIDEPMGGPFGVRGWRSLFHTGRELIPSDPLLMGLCFAGAFSLPYLAYRHFSACLILTLAALSVFAASRAHRIWPMMEELQIARLLHVVAWFGIFPTVHMLDGLTRLFSRRFGSGLAGGLWLATLLAGLAFLLEIPASWQTLPKLAIGLDEGQTAIVNRLKTSSTASRILWEDAPGRKRNDGWTALLAPLTGQAFLGGLDPESRMEHFYARLVDGRLAGRDIQAWSNEQLDLFFRRYNVGRIAVRTPGAIDRLRNYPAAVEEASAGSAIHFFTLSREGNYFLKGKGKWLEASWRRIALADVEPENGEVILSLHFQEGWVMSPRLGEIDRQVDANDPIPFIRLWLPGPASRVTLEWKGP